MTSPIQQLFLVSASILSFCEEGLFQMCMTAYLYVDQKS
ncbi:hypothetical protein I33_4067 [Bacillus subtilis subsp. subtilis str. RO-NN-1]|nr:hypothetical protein I33_4067 [Bacillus subtilis subsp. subtilis str. RO-NN-1]